MDCEILRTLYVKSNGEVPCHDDAGECVLLGVVEAEEPSWTIQRLLDNDRYAHIRSSFARGRVPWDGICQRCAFLRPGLPLQDHVGRRRLNKLQVEPTLNCDLRCPCCTSGRQRRVRPKPHVMPLGAYEGTLRSLRAERFKLKTIEYCGQGEPLSHPEFHELAALGRRYFPRARQRLITNGNFDYQAATRGLELDEIYVSCDGVRQRSYEQYRRKGSVERALKFMRDAAALGTRQAVVWKYLLFEFNDSDDELHEAQRVAERLGVDMLLFAVTASKYRSQRYTQETLATLPIVSPIVHVEHCPTCHEGARFGRRLETHFAAEAVSSWLPAWLHRRRCWAQLHELAALPEGVLTLRGWAAATKPLTHVEAYCDGRRIGSARLTSLRGDVFARHRHFLRQPAGFYLSVQLKRPFRSRSQISIVVLDGGRRRGQLVETFELAPVP
ncbi:MAG: radical SAM protein [Deltaproteobacteria bacterium]|jgi:hypothetical protein|nr:radical SAM protein [Deltaproteobacteria bacterium]MBW2531689.1 radical SAM protein [Deltaproteobacteria bacterium]